MKKLQQIGLSSRNINICAYVVGDIDIAVSADFNRIVNLIGRGVSVCTVIISGCFKIVILRHQRADPFSGQCKLLRSARKGANDEFSCLIDKVVIGRYANGTCSNFNASVVSTARSGHQYYLLFIVTAATRHQYEFVWGIVY